VFLTKKFKEKNRHYILNFFKNAMMKNIKIQKKIILFIFQNLWNLINVFKKNMGMFIQVFFMNFQILMGPRKLKCDVFNGNTQG
jgi:hypothetical protein